MKKIVSLIVMFAAIAASAFAQAPQKDAGKKEFQEKMKAEKVGYITMKLDLTEAEAQQFWPVYNKVDAERRVAQKAVRTAYKELNQAIQEGGDCTKALNNYLEAQIKVKELAKKSVATYSKVLPAEKVAKLFLAEEQFRKDMMSGSKGGHHGGPKGNGKCHPQTPPQPNPKTQK